MDTTKLPVIDEEGRNKTQQVIYHIRVARWHALKLDQTMTLEEYIKKCEEANKKKESK